MALPSLFASPPASEKLYLAIILTERYVQSAVWKFNEQQVEILERSDQHLYQDDKDCIVQVDLSLQELGKESETATEVVFGLEPGWVGQTGIKDNHKPLLKKVTQDLSLKAVGFVVLGEAVFQNLVKTQPYLMALLLELQETELRISLVKQGKILATERVGRSGNTAADLAEGLARFDKAAPALAQLPSKIILYSYQLNEDELANEEQSILHHDWATTQTFLQPPVIDILSPSNVLDAVAMEGGAAVGQSLGFSAVPVVQAKQQEAFGFHQVGEETSETLSSAELTTPTSFGVPIKNEALNNVETAAVEETAMPTDGEIAGPAATAIPAETKVSPVQKKAGFSFPRPSVSLSLGSMSHHPFMLAGFVLGLVVLMVGGYLFLSTTAEAVVKLQLETQTVTQDLNLILDPEAAAVSDTTLPVSRVTKEIEGSKTVPTSGVKLVGDRAKGKVTILNKTTAAKTFNAGTVLSSGQLKFTLDEEVTVASASVTTSGTSETKTFGKVDTPITAQAIGTESNLGKETQFTVATFDESTYSAVNPEPLTGGSSREVRVASDQDRQKVLADLRTELLQQAEADFKSQTDGDSRLVPNGRITVNSSTYSAETGDEAENLQLDLTAVVEAFSYKNDQLQPLAEEELLSQVPDNFELVPDTLQILSDVQVEASSNSGEVVLMANVTSQARPKLDLEQLKQTIANLTLTHLASTLGEKPEIKEYTVEYQPSLAERVLRSLPPAERLRIEIE